MGITAKASSADLSKILESMNQEGGFSISVVTDRQGLAIASAASGGQDPERQSAVVALVQKTAFQVRNQLGLAEADEMTLFTTDGQRLVCRPFMVHDYHLILAVLVPDKGHAYRRLTNEAIRSIQKIWTLSERGLA
jgi:predicted regulator of Ras-like GTPase activity (Roadblock/LC7/MglB family)